MYFSDSVTLRSVAVTQDADGYPVTTNTDTNVFANVLSVARAEFYAANANGIDAVLTVQVHVEDWSNQTQLVYDSQTYYIVRAYQKGQGIVELTCSDKAT